MAGPYADYAVKAPNLMLTTTSTELGKFFVPSHVGDELLQIQIHTEGTNLLKAVIRINNQVVLSYGPSSTNMTRMLQEVFTGKLVTGTNIITGEVLSGTGFLTVKSFAVWWQTN